MGQVTIYLDAETEARLNAIVKASQSSKSKWIADLIREKAATSWPKNIAELAGAWKDLPTAEEIRKTMGQDAVRESL